MIDLTNIDFMLIINRLTPLIAILLTLMAIFNRKYITKDCISSSIMHLTIVFWVMLIWADWGSVIFQPSKQTVVARCVMLFILWLVVLLVKHYSILVTKLKDTISTINLKFNALTKQYRSLQSDYARLTDENKQLKKLLQDEITQGEHDENQR